MKLKSALSFAFLFHTNAFKFLSRRSFGTSLVASYPAIMSLSSDDDNSKPTFLQEDANSIYFYGSVTPETCFVLKNRIHELTSKSKRFSYDYNTLPFPIHLHIQSGGGSLFPTIYVVDLIKNQDSSVPIYTYVDGYAASAATLLSVAGSKRYMTKNSLMLIHQLSSGAEHGKYMELKDNMQNMDSLMKIIVSIYKENTKLTDDKLYELLQKDIWLNSSQCLEYGLVDFII